MSFLTVIRDAFLGMVTNKAIQARANVRKTVTAYRLDIATTKAKDQETEKTKAEIENIRIKTRKERVDSISSILKLGLTVGTAYGFVLVFVYCFTLAKFFPSGFSVGDTALLLFVAIAFGIAASLFAALGFMPFAPWVNVQGIQDSPAHSSSTPLSCPPPSWQYHLTVVAFLGWISAFVSAWTGSRYWLLAFPQENGSSYVTDYTDLGLVILATCLVLEIEIASLQVLITRQRAARSPMPTEKEIIKENRLDYFSHVLNWMVGVGVWGVVGGALLLADNGLGYVLAALLGGFSIALSLATLDGANADGMAPEKKKNRLQLSIFFVGAALILPPAVSLDLSTSALKRFVMSNLGIYSERSALWVSADNLSTLQSAAQLLNSPLSVCRNSDGSAVVTDLRIWWHGIGARTYAELLDLNTPVKSQMQVSENTSRRLELKSEGARIIQSADARCTELGEEFIFRSNNHNPDPSNNPKARICESLGPFIKLAAPTYENGLHISQIEVIGHTDPMARKKSSNEQLGLERANEIKTLILAVFKDSGKISDENIIVPKTGGATSPIKDCSEIRDGAQAKECNSVNRRVQIRLHYAKTEASTKEPPPHLKKDPCSDNI